MKKNHEFSSLTPQVHVFGMWQWLIIIFINFAIHAPGSNLAMPWGSEFPNEGYGYQNFDFHFQKSPIAIKFQHSV